MEWIGILLVSPIWGATSTQLFLQAWLAVVNFFINFLGFVKGTVSRRTTALAMGAAIFGIVLFSLLLRGGVWLFTEILPFGRTQIENVVYWVFAGLSALVMLPQIPSKLRKTWRNALSPGSLEADILKRKLGLNPKHE